MTIKEIETLIERHEDLATENQAIIERIKRFNVADKNIVKLEQEKQFFLDTAKALTILKRYKFYTEDVMNFTIINSIESKVYEWFNSHNCEYMSIEDILFLLLETKGEM